MVNVRFVLHNRLFLTASTAKYSTLIVLQKGVKKYFHAQKRHIGNNNSGNTQSNFINLE